MFDFKLKMWLPLVVSDKSGNQFTPALKFHTLTSYNQKGCFFFGGSNALNIVSNDLFYVDNEIIGISEAMMTIEKVQTTGKPPIPRSQHTAAILNNYLVIFGGRNNSLYPRNVALNDFHLLKIKTREWQSLALFGEEIPESRFGHSMTALKDRIIIFGGANLKHYCAADVFEVRFEGVKEYIQRKIIRSKNVFAN